MQKRAEVAALPGFHFGINNIVFSPDGKLLAGTDGDHRILIWDLTTAEADSSFPAMKEGFVTAIAYAPDGKTIAVAADNVIRLREITTDKQIAQLTGHAGRVVSLAFLPDGKQLLSGSTAKDGTTRLWCTCPKRKSFVNGRTKAALSPYHRMVGTWLLAATVRLRELPSGKEVAQLNYSGSPPAHFFSGREKPGGGALWC